MQAIVNFRKRYVQKISEKGQVLWIIDLLIEDHENINVQFTYTEWQL